MNHHHPTFLANPAVAVVESIDGGVELVVAPQCHHDQASVRQPDRLHGRTREIRPARCGREFADARAVGQVESALVLHPLVVALKTRNDLLDGAPDVAVMAQVLAPRHRMVLPEKRQPEQADNRRFTQQLIGNRLQIAARRLDDAH